MKEKRKALGCDFNRGDSAKDVLLFVLPLVLTGLFQQGYSLLNTAVISRYLDAAAIAVRGSLGTLSAIQSYLALGVTTGFVVFLNRCYGQGDPLLYRRSMTGSCLLVGGLLVLSLILAGGVEGLLALVNMPGELWEEGRAYLTILLFGTAFTGMKNLLLGAVQGMGHVRIFGMVSILGTMSNTGILLLLLNGGYRKVSAMPLAALCNDSGIILFLSIFLVIFRRTHVQPVGISQIPADIFYELLKSGGSKSAMMILAGIGGIFMQRARNTLGTAAIAGYSYADTLSNFFLVPISAIASMAGIAAARNRGRQDYDSLWFYARNCLRWSLGFSGTAMAAAFGLGIPFLEILSGGADQETIQAGYLWLCICIPAFSGLGSAMICRNSLQAMGDYGKLLCLGVIEMGITVWFALCLVPHWGYPAVCLSIFTKWMALGAAAFLWFRKRLKRSQNTGFEKSG